MSASDVLAALLFAWILYKVDEPKVLMFYVFGLLCFLKLLDEKKARRDRARRMAEHHKARGWAMQQVSLFGALKCFVIVSSCRLCYL
jgi:hypothetical protein